MQELIAVGFSASTSPIEAMRPAGILTLLVMIEHFGGTEDPDYEGHLLLEQYHAQTAAALRPCFAADAEPSLTASGCALVSSYLPVLGSSANGHEVDPVAISRLLSLLTKLISPSGLADVYYPAFSESAATMVRVAALRGAADVMKLALAPATAPRYVGLLKAVLPSLPAMRDCWMAMLRDLALLYTQPKAARRSYTPHLYTHQTASSALAQMLEAWPAVLSAVVATVPTASWTSGREGATPIGQSARAPSPALGGEADGAAGECRPIAPRPEAEDHALLLGLASHRLAVYAESSGQVSAEEAEEAQLCASALAAVLTPARGLSPAETPPGCLLRLVYQVRAASGVASPDVSVALATLVAHLCANAGPYISAAGGGADAAAAAELTAALSSLAAAPLLRAIPHLGSVHAVATAAAAPPAPPAPLPALDEATATAAALALQAVAALPVAITPPSARLTHIPSALLLTLHMCHAAAADATTTTLADAALAAVRALLAALPLDDPDPSSAASALALARAATQTSLHLLAGTGPQVQVQPVHALLACAALLPPPVAGAPEPLLARVHETVGALLAGPLAGQRAAIAAVQADLAAASAAGASARLGAQLGAALPAAAPLLLPSTPDAAADKPAALKLLLLGATLAPPGALTTLLSLVLPLLVGCLSVSSDPPPSPARRELASLAHASVTALAKRSPAEFRDAASGFSPETRARMETALREAAAASQQVQAAASPAAGQPPAAAPKIALKMDFGGFGK